MSVATDHIFDLTGRESNTWKSFSTVGLSLRACFGREIIWIHLVGFVMVRFKRVIILWLNSARVNAEMME
jgi:hypothetical protein